MSQSTLVLIKPHAVAEGLTSRVTNYYVKAGLRIVAIHVLTFKEEQARTFYSEHCGKPFFETLIASMCQGPTVALILRGESAIKKAREINGKTSGQDADPGTIRRDFFRNPGGVYNTVHGSDSVSAVAREMKTVFPHPLPNRFS